MTVIELFSSPADKGKGRATRSRRSSLRRQDVFNPFAKLSDSPSRPTERKKRTAFELQLLHEHCSLWARQCWGLWNQGYPIARILHHFPDKNDGNYFLHLDPELNFYVNDLSELAKAPSPHSIPNESELIAFLIDLIRLKKVAINGHFALTWMDTDFHFDREFTGSKFYLVPLLSHIDGKSLEPFDPLSTAKLAASVTSPAKKRRFNSCKSIEAILQCLEPLRFRKDKQSEGASQLVVDIENSPHLIWLKWQHEFYRVSPNPHGLWLVSPNPEKHAKGIVINVQITPYPSASEKNPFTEHALTWVQQPKLWMEGQRSYLVRDMLASFCAEEQHAENSGFKYSVVASDLEKGLATIRVQQKNGSANAHDLWDLALNEREMLVALNRKESVFDWHENDVWHLNNIDETDPFILHIGSINTHKIPDEGYLKLASVPHRALMRRKERLVRTGVTLEGIRRLQTPAYYEGNIPNWRLSKRAGIMTLQGPPGTGKTWTATNIVHDLLQENPFARILVCAKEHLALEHLAVRIRDQLPDRFDVVRINKSESHPSNEIPNEITPEGVAQKITKQLGLKASTLKEVGKTATWVDEVAMRTCSVICTTTLDKTMELLQRSGFTFDFAIVEEAGKCYPSEMIGPASVSMNTLLIGDHMQLPPFELTEIEKNLEIVFEDAVAQWSNKKASKSIARQMIDLTAKHYQRHEINTAPHAEEAKHWLQPFQALHRITEGDMLENQWRMFDTLSTAIGRTFYGQPFKQKNTQKYSNTSLPNYFGKYNNRLLFFDESNGEEKINNKSLANENEATFVASVLKNLLDDGHETMAITPYNGQVDAIRKKLPANYHDSVRTVDGFQGKEADFIILSLVRKNQRTGASRRWGFFRDPRRINVAFSRAREGLLVVSSTKHIRQTDWNKDEDHLMIMLREIEEQGCIFQERD